MLIKGQYQFLIQLNIPLHGIKEFKTKKYTNEITKEGLKHIAHRIIDNNTNIISHIEISTQKANITQNKLEGDTTRQKILKTTKKDDEATITFITAFTVKEMVEKQYIGLFNKENGGTLIAHSPFQEDFTGLPENALIFTKYELLFMGD